MTGSTGSSDGCGSNDWTLASEGGKKGGGGGGGEGRRNISYIHTKYFVIPHKPEWSQGVGWSSPENHYIIVTS